MIAIAKARLSKKQFAVVSVSLWNSVFITVAIICLNFHQNNPFMDYIAINGRVASPFKYEGETFGGFVPKPRYQATPSFSYKVGGIEYHGLPLDMHRYSTRPNGGIRLYYDPLHPGTFVLSRRNMPKSWQVVLAMTIVGIGVWTVWLIYKKKVKRIRHPHEATKSHVGSVRAQ